MTLKEFIIEQVALMGIDDFKHQFDVTESTINHWRRGVCLPRTKQMHLIVKLSKGRVSLVQIFADFQKAQAEKYGKKSK